MEYVELLNKYHNAQYVELPMLIHIILIDISDIMHGCHVV